MYKDLENFMRKISSREQLSSEFIKTASIVGFLEGLAKASRGAEEGAISAAKFNEVFPKLLKTNPEGFTQAFNKLNKADQGPVINYFNKNYPGGFSAAGKAAREAATLYGESLKIEKGIRLNPGKFTNIEPEIKAIMEAAWQKHPSLSGTSLDDFIKQSLEAKGLTTPAARSSATTVVDTATAIGREPKVLDEVLTLAREGKTEEAGSALKKVLESEGKTADDIIKELDELTEAERSLVEGVTKELDSTVGAKEYIKKIKETASTGSAELARPTVPKSPAEIAETERLTAVEVTPTTSSEVIADKVGAGAVTVDDAAKIGELPAAKKVEVLSEVADEPAKVKEILETAPDSPAAKAITAAADDVAKEGPTFLQRMKAAGKKVNPKLVAGIAAGLTGIGLIYWLWGGEEESEDKDGSGGGLFGGESGSEGGSSGGGGGGATGGSSAADFEYASGILKEKGYLSTTQDSWTPEFNSAFNAFIDAGSANNRNVKKTNLSGGEKWSAVAPGLGFSPDEEGGLQAIKAFARFVPAKSGGSGGGSGGVDTGGGSGQTITGKQAVLAEIISLLYHDRLAEGGGFLSREKKQTQSVVDAVGGASPSGYENAAKILLGRNPSLNSFLPEKLEGPITKKNVKSLAVFPAIQQTQKTIHELFESANPGAINPGQEKATQNVLKYVQSPAGGNWKGASNNSDRLVKLAERRKERIMAEVAAELTPAERAALRIFKMRGA
jgi:uncharacterized protein (DUF2267 family)